MSEGTVTLESVKSTTNCDDDYKAQQMEQVKVFQVFQTTPWEHVQLFLLARYPRLFMFIWGSEILDCLESLYSLDSPEDPEEFENNKVIMNYLRKRSNHAQIGNKKSVEKIKLIPQAGQ
jgi:hypothetical protein